MASESSGAASEFRRSVSDASRRIGEIIDDAESAAAKIRAEAHEDARKEAQRAVNESAAELATVVSPLVDRVETLREEAAGLMNELQAITERLRNLTQPGSISVPPVPVPKRAEPPPDPKPEASPIPEKAPETKEAPPTESPAPAEPDPPDPGPKPVAYPGTAAPEADSDSLPPEEALLRATQMAVAGSSREEIEVALRDEFSLDDPGAAVDDILGPA